MGGGGSGVMGKNGVLTIFMESLKGFVPDCRIKYFLSSTKPSTVTHLSRSPLSICAIQFY